MRIHLHTEGGLAHFPGLNRAVVVDTKELAPDAAEQLEQLVHGMGFFEMVERVDPDTLHPGRADYRSHIVTVEESERSHTVRADEPIVNPQLKTLIELLRKLERRPA
jgi:hypothetical protein